MPEEIGIILLLVVGAIWLLVVILKAVANAISQAEKSFAVSSARRLVERYRAGRAKLSPFVQIIVPDQLDKVRKAIEVAEVDFVRFKDSTTWVAERPSRKNDKFVPYQIRRKSADER
jgi:hypothetical protein